MGLLSKIITIRWNSKNIKHYKEKGYIFTKKGDNLNVSVEDLSNSSHEKVECKCDGCGKILKNIVWQNYKSYVQSDGSYYCNLCSRSGNQKWKSFEQWCIENNRQDVLDRWDYKLNNCKPSEITYSVNINKYWFKCFKGLHNSELKNINSFTNGEEGSISCNKCNSFAQYLINQYGENALELYWSKKNTFNPWDITKNCAKYIYLICQNKDYHDDYIIQCYQFVTGNRCPYCTNRNGKVHKLDSLGMLCPNVFDIWSNKNKKSPYDYAPKSTQKVWWKCKDNKHDDYYRSICSSNVCNFRCPECVEEQENSRLQIKVNDYLVSLGYLVLHENKCTLSPKNIIKLNLNINTRKLRYDNEILINNNHLIIEVHGKQHYIIDSFHSLNAKHNNTTPEQELKYQKDKDVYKEQYALSKNYEYLIIPYWTEIDESYKQLIDAKINEIKLKDSDRLLVNSLKIKGVK